MKKPNLNKLVPLVCALLLTAPLVHAQTYPSKPIRWIVPSSAGGGNDFVARLFGARLTESWGQQVLVDLRPGAAGILGSELLVNSAPDGYTIMIVATGYGLNPSLYAKLPYDTINDFARINLLAFSPNVLVVHPSLPVKSVKELIAFAKKLPGELNYGSSGAGTGGHLSIELMKYMAGLKMTHVPYKGAGASTAAVVSGEIPMLMTAPGAAIPFVKAGRLRALAVGSAKRVKAMPDVPTMAEAALPGYEVDGFYGVLAPAKTPRAIVDKLYAELDRIIKLPDVNKQMEDRGFDPVSYTPEQFTEHVKKEMKKWPPVFKAAGIKVNN
ncbi:MAG: tripartite tricarboxylate transporter substrate binding protein [Betaproteobacteria bacterium]|jgi:tripartite-type tricarboxylate transporter receptor subunit TctC|nr:tripartite tricarboxylate transporter substrate binding protein [Betaproteobacteria bacterium]MDH5343092.1 tripartite tricarboxylate transporter substrate binding protein [Betaproteobacteria bacterium]